jgi:DNA-binding LytR/AlgR family response regulator
MSFSYLIIDPTTENSTNIKALFEIFPKYTCIGIVTDKNNIAEYLYKSKPQLVLINLPNDEEYVASLYTSILELFQYADEIPHLIALSDSDKYALKSIQAGFSDYIIQPLVLHELGKSLFKFEKKNPMNPLKTICIKSHSDYQFIALKNIVCLKADNTTTDIILDNGKIVNAFKTLKHFENLLPFNFSRIHKSYIVNIYFVNRIQMVKSNCYLNNGEIIPFSKSYKDNIIEIIKKISN